MYVSNVIASSALGRQRTTTIQSRRTPIAVRVAASITICLAVCITLVITLARTAPIPIIRALPQRFLPGSVLPFEAYCTVTANGGCSPKTYISCNQPGDGRCFTYPSFVVGDAGKKVHLTVEITSGTITQALLPAGDFTMGSLMLAWGSPTGFGQSGNLTIVYWGTRGVFFATCSFRPEGRPMWMTYYAEPVKALPWRGFAQADSGCNTRYRN